MLFAALFIALTAGGIAIVHDELAGHSLSFDRRLVSWPVLASAAVLLAVYYATDALRLGFTLKALGHPVALPTLLRLVFVNQLFSNITPLATGGGFAQVWFLRRHGVPIGTATAATTVRTLLAVAFLFSAAPLLLIFLDAAEHVALGGLFALYLVVFVALYLGFFAMLLFHTRRLIAPLHAVLRLLYGRRVIGERRYRRWRFKLLREVVRFARGFGGYLRGRPSDLLLSVIFSALFLVSLFSFPALLLYALGYDSNWLASTGLAALTTFIMYFSPTPGASGVAEGLFARLFSHIVAANQLVLFTLAWRFLTVHLGMLLGIAATQYELSKGGERTCPDAAASRPSST